MTREEIKKAMRDTKKEVVLKNLHKLLSLVEGYPEYEDCVGYAIEKLEQEPFDNRPCISSGVCEHDKQKVLDKIRAEIAEHADRLKDSLYGDGLRHAIQIIDKYKAESED